MGEGTAVLEARDLAVGRGGLSVLAGLSFRVEAGRALILRGPNGAGKTTLLRTLAGLLPATAGEARVAADSIAYAGHADGIKAQLTVAENLGFWAAMHGRAEVGRALEAMDLVPLAGRLARELSAGQKRRLGLARMAVTGRAVWLMDEPTVSLDVAAVAGFAAMVRAHLREGGVAVIATHADLGLPEAAVLDVAPYRARVAELFGGEDFA